MDYIDYLGRRVDDVKKEGRYRVFANIERIVGRFPRAKYYMKDGSVKEITIWCSNDYLGMGQHPKVLAAAKNALLANGAGAGGTRNISGTTRYHVDLEASVADLHQKEAALVFSSGYVANDGTLSTLGKLLPDCVILSDEMNHASMIQGIRGARCDKVIYRHNDLAHLEACLKELPRERAKIIAFESVYSMDGDIAPIEETIELARKYNAMTYLDEVHAVGLYGPRGGGVAEERGLLQDVDVIEGTFGKAYGCMGGFITGAQQIVDAVRCYASSFIFTTSLPPAVLAGARAAVEHLKVSDVERKKMHRNVGHFKGLLESAGLPFMQGESHIVPVVVGEPNCCREVTDILMSDYDIYVQPINYPTVPKGTERLRLTATAVHSIDDVEHMAGVLSELWSSHHALRAVA